MHKASFLFLCQILTVMRVGIMYPISKFPYENSVVKKAKTLFTPLSQKNTKVKLFLSS